MTSTTTPTTSRRRSTRIRSSATREEEPLHYNERFDLYVLSRYSDLARVYNDRETFISSRGTILPYSAG